MYMCTDTLEVYITILLSQFNSTQPSSSSTVSEDSTLSTERLWAFTQCLLWFHLPLLFFLLCIPGLSSVCSGIVSSAAVSLATRNLRLGYCSMVLRMCSWCWLVVSSSCLLDNLGFLHAGNCIRTGSIIFGLGLWWALSMFLCTSICQYVVVNIHLLVYCLCA